MTLNWNMLYARIDEHIAKALDPVFKELQGCKQKIAEIEAKLTAACICPSANATKTLLSNVHNRCTAIECDITKLKITNGEMNASMVKLYEIHTGKRSREEDANEAAKRRAVEHVDYSTQMAKLRAVPPTKIMQRPADAHPAVKNACAPASVAQMTQTKRGD